MANPGCIHSGTSREYLQAIGPAANVGLGRGIVVRVAAVLSTCYGLVGSFDLIGVDARRRRYMLSRLDRTMEARDNGREDHRGIENWREVGNALNATH